MHVLVAPDSMGGRLSASDVATAIVAGWRRVRPRDDVATVPMSDGGEGLLEVLHGADDRAVAVEVADPLGRPQQAWLSLGADGSAVVESAMACGLHLVDRDARDPLRATTFGVGQLLEAARHAGARRVLVGLGGSATVDGGAGALAGLGFRLRVADGSGLKVGAADLGRVAGVERGWCDAGWDDVEVVLLADVRTPLAGAARTFGPQKGATRDVVDHLEEALAHWAEVVARDLEAPGLEGEPGAGAAGGLGFGLAAGLGGMITAGAAAVADAVDLDAQLAATDLVITGEGRLDATSFDGKVVGEVLARASGAGRDTAVVAGTVALDAETDAPLDDVDVERAAGDTPAEVRAELEAAGERLARRLGRG